MATRQFKLLKSGALDLEVDDRWSLDGIAKIDSHWKIAFRALQTKNRLLRAVVKKLGTKKFEFRLKLDGRGLRHDHSTNAKPFWLDVGAAIFAKLLGSK